MAGVSLKGLGKSYGEVEVLRGVELDVADGEFVVLVGPSGCGKSTLLRCIAGLEVITEGELSIGGRRVNEVAPRDRDVAMVFQSYALYPHMTVRRNMSFALEIRKAPAAEIEAAVGEAAAMLGLEPLLDRLPRALSGGQRQRVAIGRAIVRRPQVFLFDEPLSNLDAALRGQMRVELKRLHQQLQSTIIYVTHDQVEAMTLADRIVVLEGGVVQQVGSPRELYERPANRFVAGFIGSPAMNFLEATGRDGQLRAGSLALPSAHSGPVTVGIRPHDVQVSRGGGGALARVEVVERLGWELHLHLRLDGQPLTAQVEAQALGEVRAGEELAVRLGRYHLFDAHSGRSIAVEIGI